MDFSARVRVLGLYTRNELSYVEKSVNREKELLGLEC